MRTYTLEEELSLPIGIAEAWSFFSSPRNLALITPPQLRLAILPPFNDEPMHTGQHIHYTVRPLLGIPLRWETLISDVDEPHRFTDKQLRGPYSLWEHTHTFVERPNGVQMHDLVRYALPFGVLGLAAHALFVERQLKAIFGYRRKQLQAIFVRPTA